MRKAEFLMWSVLVIAFSMLMFVWGGWGIVKLLLKFDITIDLFNAMFVAGIFVVLFLKVFLKKG